MAVFEPALQLVLKHEGGYVNDKDDPGGPTNMGITQAVLSAYMGRQATVDEVHAMSVNTARSIYRDKYWATIKGDQFSSQEAANHVFDLSVLRGVGNGVRAMQQALGQEADGVAGPKTIAALNKANAAMFLNVFRSLCVQAFAQIVTKRPASLKFLCNWTHRAEEITDTISVLSQKTSSQVAQVAPGPVAAKT